MVWPLFAAGLLVLSSIAIAFVSRSLRPSGGGHWTLRLVLLVAMPMAIAALGAELYGQWQTGLRPSESSYGALVYAFIGLQSIFTGTLLLMGLYTLARSLCGLLDGERRATFDNTMLFWHYTVGQSLVGLAIVHGFPRLIG